MKYIKGKFKFHPKEGLEMEGNLSGWIQFCIGLGILFLAASPFLLALAYFIKLIGV